MRYANPSPRALRAIAILLLTTISTGCTGLGAKTVIPRELPPKPAWAAAVAVARPAAGTDWREVAKIEQNARRKANARLVEFGRWYDERRAEFASGK